MPDSFRRPGVGIAAAGLFIAVGLGAAAFLIGQSFVDMRAAERSVTVKGLAERDVEADIASWRIPFRGTAADRQVAVAEALAARDTVIAFAREGGLSPEEMTVEPFTLRVERVLLTENGQQREHIRFVAVGALRLRSGNVEAVADLTGKTPLLLDRGVLLGQTDYAETPRAEFLFTALNDVKPQLIADATRNARQAAERFAADSDSSIGKIVSANQGVIRLLARDGNYDERYERRKTVRVVTTLRYRLTD